MSDETMVLRGGSLQIHWPDGRTETLGLGQPETLLGRDPECQIVVPTEMNTISRKHAMIRLVEGGFTIEDLGSANGVDVNGERIHAARGLADGDEIQIGEGDQIVRLVYLTQVAQAVAAQIKHDSGATPIPTPLSEITERKPFITVRWPSGRVTHHNVDPVSMLFGRNPEAQFRIPENIKFISGDHFKIMQDGTGFVVIDLASTNGTYLNGVVLQPHTPTPIRNTDVLRIGDEAFGVSLGIVFNVPEERAQVISGFSQAQESPTSLIKRQTILVGRSAEADLTLKSQTVSRQHARIETRGESYYIADLQSANGTYVNGEWIQTKELFDGDLIEVGNHLLLFQDGAVTPYNSQGMRVDVIGLAKDIRDGRNLRRILHETDMTILPREFVAVVGGSGAGKSTFMRALNGSNPGAGAVRLNGHDFYKQYDRFRHELGYVPQSDILHMSLSVEKALDYAARLRLPADVSAKERQTRIAEVLNTVSMNTPEIKRTKIANLSGGQRKRVSIAAELLADPKLIYLDEATSGLDPGLEKKMMHTLRRMADEGRTIVLITHATANIVQADHVAFLSQGRLIYYGPSTQALDFFEVAEFADIYEQIERHGEQWERTFKEEKPENHQRYVVERAQSLKALPPGKLQNRSGVIGDFFRQLLVLTQRAFEVIASDWITLVLLLLLFPLTATLQLVIATPEVLTGNLSIMADVGRAARDLTTAYLPFPDTNVFVFVMGLEAVLVGLFVPSNELIKERTVYLRERMVNLQVLPYLLSKVIVFTIFSALQVLLYLVVISLGVDFPESGLYMPGILEIFITLFLTMLAGNGLGLFISSMSKNTEMGIYLLTLMLFFQFFFAGAVFDLRDNSFESLSYFTGTRWSLTALGVTIGMEDITEASIICQPLDNPATPQIEDDQFRCMPHPKAVDDMMLAYPDEALLQSWGALILMMLVGLGATGVMVKRLDRM